MAACRHIHPLHRRSPQPVAPATGSRTSTLVILQGKEAASRRPGGSPGSVRGYRLFVLLPWKLELVFTGLSNVDHGNQSSESQALGVRLSAIWRRRANAIRVSVLDGAREREAARERKKSGARGREKRTRYKTERRGKIEGKERRRPVGGLDLFCGGGRPLRRRRPSVDLLFSGGGVLFGGSRRVLFSGGGVQQRLQVLKGVRDT
ncbi:hypothetical protein GUJ93_ZPchr0012g20066 [Zizania palustris]|uniref:Uncharacterized protein n=1 Tax=Zizania palustris TaxID=103762 RepID=A0A8J6BVH8_ZIZPA|nr:hypothetical protein GUJ93_ZPchr0012g20066 [Zizania palustris]